MYSWVASIYLFVFVANRALPVTHLWPNAAAAAAPTAEAAAPPSAMPAAEVAAARARALGFLSQVLGGDDVAAEFAASKAEEVEGELPKVWKLCARRAKLLLVLRWSALPAALPHV